MQASAGEIVIALSAREARLLRAMVEGQLHLQKEDDAPVLRAIQAKLEAAMQKML